MKILIIGGTGLISTAITRVLQERGHEVIPYNRGRVDSQLAETPATIVGDRKDYPAFAEWGWGFTDRSGNFPEMRVLA